MSETKKRGRPSKFSDKVATDICERLASGESLRSICRDERMPHRATIHRWLIDNVDGFCDRYARAREVGLDELADETLEIADSPAEGQRIEEGPDGKKVVREDMLGHRRLQVDTRKWLLSKFSPKKYGDKQQIEHSGSIGLEALVAGDEQ